MAMGNFILAMGQSVLIAFPMSIIVVLFQLDSPLTISVGFVAASIPIICAYSVIKRTLSAA